MRKTKVDTIRWGEFVIGDYFSKLDLKCKKEKFNKRQDVSEEKSKEFSLPLVNAKYGNNGIMFYGREEDFDSEEMCLDIVKNGAVATGSVYPQPQKTGVLWDAYLIKCVHDISKYTLCYLATTIQKHIKEKYSYDDKAVWNKVKEDKIKLLNRV